MSTLQPSPYANPASVPQTSVASQYPSVGVPVPMNMSSLTPGMAAVQAYRARGGAPLSRGGMTGLGNAFGAQGGGDTSGLGAAQAMQGQIQQPQTQPSPYGAAIGTMNALRPPSGYSTGVPLASQTYMMGNNAPTMGGMGIRTQGAPNARGIGVGRIRAPRMNAFNNRY